MCILVADHFVVHYLPATYGYIANSLQHIRPITDVRALNDKVLAQSEQKPWTLTYVHAAIRGWWLAEYSGYFTENHESNLTQNQLEEGEFVPLENSRPDTYSDLRK